QPLLNFRPSTDDYNLDNTAENRNGRNPDGGHRGNYYCEIKYNVVDDDNATSVLDKTININVVQLNDIPRERFGTDKTGTINIVDAKKFLVLGLEDYPVIMYIDPTDVENDDFDVKVVACGRKGTFYF